MRTQHVRFAPPPHARRYTGVWDFMRTKGGVSEAQDTYVGVDRACGNLPTTFRATTWGYVDSSVSVPTVAKLKVRALLTQVADDPATQHMRCACMSRAQRHLRAS